VRALRLCMRPRRFRCRRPLTFTCVGRQAFSMQEASDFYMHEAPRLCKRFSGPPIAPTRSITSKMRQNCAEFGRISQHVFQSCQMRSEKTGEFAVDFLVSPPPFFFFSLQFIKAIYDLPEHGRVVKYLIRRLSYPLLYPT